MQNDKQLKGKPVAFQLYGTEEEFATTYVRVLGFFVGVFRAGSHQNGFYTPYHSTHIQMNLCPGMLK